ncbi:type IV secretion system DNA-binding domain-containing protein [Patescibacteria group bacterium]|nr:type IV secretion system DNA-binding domain-containing protein [Patescibacteria group bacterium]MCL5410136.1 type IV secretion system DNA-binding domain-containing protein [Patescibacteria group bacterium]
MEVSNAPQFDLTGFLTTVTLGFLAVSVIVLLLLYLWKYIAALLKGRGREKSSLEAILLQVSVPKDNEVKIDATEQLISTLNSIKKNTGFLGLKPQAFLSFEIVALHESIKFYISVHKSMEDLIEKQIHGAYPDALIKKVPEYNIFTEKGETAYAQLKLKSADYYPIKTYRDLPTDPLSALTSALAKMQPGEGAAVQVIIAPSDGKWKDAGKAWLKKEKDPGKPDSPKPAPDAKQLEAVENKLGKPGFDTVIRLVTSSTSKESAKAHLTNLKAAFEQFAGPYNNFSSASLKDGFFKQLILPFAQLFKLPIKNAEEGFMTDFIYRFMPLTTKPPVLTPDEIASVFHFPSKIIQTPYLDFLPARAAPASEKIPTSGLYLGKSVFRGIERPVYISEEDRQRHMYIIGRTGTGKTTLLKTLMLQDILAGKGLAFIDPHGDAAEELLSLIPPQRAKDVIYFDPGDTERPFGMNMIEAHSEDEKHFITTEILGLMYKLYDPNKTGIIGPRFEHGVRNAMLTAMAKPGNTFVEVMRIMQDPEFVKELLPLVNDPIVRRYWTDQIAHTQDFHKSEVLDYTVSKFGRFVTNKMLRNIIGQSKSSFDLRQIMDEGKILIVNLSKGRMGEENSNFLGLILVPKILAAAMSRANLPEEQRKPFYLYVDEFQNFATDTFATILSEARKYRLNLIVANQFIGQIPEDIKNAIFGNVGTLISYRVGVTDANFLQHEFTPTFTESDLVNIEAWHVYVKTQVKGEPVPPFSMRVDIDFNTWNSMKRPDIANAIKELSRLTYGRDMVEVEAEITRRAQL